MLRSILALLLALSACDSGTDSSGGGDGGCIGGATLTATVGDQSFAAACVELEQTSSGYLISGSAGVAANRSVEVLIAGREAGTFPVSGATLVTSTLRQVEGDAVTRTTLVVSGSGQVLVAEASGGRGRGTFEVVGREQVTAADGTATTGDVVEVSGSFNVPR